MHKSKPHLGRWGLVLAAVLGAGILATTNQATTQPVVAASNYSKVTNQYVVVKKSGYNFWNNFNWSKKLHYSKNYLNRTLQVKRIYYKSNGSKYYSTYRGGKWFGYVNAGAATIVKNAQGSGIATSKYAIMNKSGWSTYSNFNWKVNHLTKNYLKHNFQVKRIYYHANGSTYYSLYRGGKWFGYINASALTSTTKQQGNAITIAKPFAVYLNNLDANGYHQDKVWRNLSFSKSMYANKTAYPIKYTVKTIYYHSNGYTYYSLYQGNKWVGYTNANNATTQEFTVGEVVVYFKTKDGNQVDLVAGDGDTGSTIDFAGQIPDGYEAAGNTKFVVQGGKGQVETVTVEKPTTKPSISNDTNESANATDTSDEASGSTAATSNKAKINVVCEDTKGNVIKTYVAGIADVGSDFKLDAPEIDGYTINGLSGGTFEVERDNTITFKYDKEVVVSSADKQKIYNEIANKMLADINAYRVQKGRKVVASNPIMQKIANLRAPQLLKYFEHATPDGDDFAQFAYDEGWTGISNENILESLFSNDGGLLTVDTTKLAQEMVQVWIDSPMHNATLLDKHADYAAVGVSSGIGSNGLYQMVFAFEEGSYNY